jgi:hypothetical protein
MIVLTNVKINSAAAISYSKLNLAASITRILRLLLIAYSKLSLANSIVRTLLIVDTKLDV